MYKYYDAILRLPFATHIVIQTVQRFGKDIRSIIVAIVYLKAMKQTNDPV